MDFKRIEANGGGFDMATTIGELYGLLVTTVVTDEVQRVYCRGLRDGMAGDRRNALQWGTYRTRIDHPEAEVHEVVVELEAGSREFTWQEFDAWVDA